MTSLVILSSVASNIFKHVVGVTYQRICLIASTTSGGNAHNKNKRNMFEMGDWVKFKEKQRFALYLCESVYRKTDLVEIP